jgi:hypothetical protein
MSNAICDHCGAPVYRVADAGGNRLDLDPDGSIRIVIVPSPPNVADPDVGVRKLTHRIHECAESLRDALLAGAASSGQI